MPKTGPKWAKMARFRPKTSLRLAPIPGARPRAPYGPQPTAAEASTISYRAPSTAPPTQQPPRAHQHSHKMPSGKGSKLLRYVEHRLRVSLSDRRTIVGTFLAFDKHLNLVLADAEEFRTLKSNRAAIVEERVEKRALGLIILRGENVVSVAVEGPPPPLPGAKYMNRATMGSFMLGCSSRNTRATLLKTRFCIPDFSI